MPGRCASDFDGPGDGVSGRSCEFAGAGAGDRPPRRRVVDEVEVFARRRSVDAEAEERADARGTARGRASRPGRPPPSASNARARAGLVPELGGRDATRPSPRCSCDEHGQPRGRRAAAAGRLETREHRREEQVRDGRGLADAREARRSGAVSSAGSSSIAQYPVFELREASRGSGVRRCRSGRCGASRR